MTCKNHSIGDGVKRGSPSGALLGLHYASRIEGGGTGQNGRRSQDHLETHRVKPVLLERVFVAQACSLWNFVTARSITPQLTSTGLKRLRKNYIFVIPRRVFAEESLCALKLKSKRDSSLRSE